VDIKRLRGTELVDSMLYKTIKGIKVNVWIINGNQLEKLTVPSMADENNNYKTPFRVFSVFRG